MREAVVLVAGSRSITDSDLVMSLIEEQCNKLVNSFNIRFVSGGAKGVDSIAEQFAKKVNADITVVLPDWNKYGKSAGYIRNQEMLTNHNVTHVIAITNGSRGTAHTIGLAVRKGLPTVAITVHDTNYFKIEYLNCNEKDLSKREVQLELPL